MYVRRLISTTTALVVVIASVYVRSLAVGWMFFLLGIPYLIVLGTHVFIHWRYTCNLRFNLVTTSSVTLSYLALFGAFLLQLDFQDTPDSTIPIVELLELESPTFFGGLPELIVNLLLFIPALVSWFYLRKRASVSHRNVIF